MRNRWLAVIFVTAAGAAAQVAPDIGPGATSNAVIRSYGWPRGRSVSGDRQTWQYDAFEITLDRGVVVDVRPIPGAKPAPRKSVRPSSSVQVAPLSRAAPIPPASVPRPMTILPVAPSPQPPGTPLQETDRTLRSFFRVIVLGLTTFGLVVVAVIVRRRRHRVVQATNEPSEVMPSSSAEDVIASTLQRFHEREGIPTSEGAPHAFGAPLTLERLQSLEWKRFELIVARYFEARGLRCQRTRVGADGGVDAYLYRNAEPRSFACVQCKSWNSYTVGVKPVRELFGVMAAEQIPEGFFVTTATFTEEARRWTTGKTLQLIDGDEFLRRYNSLSADTRSKIEREVYAGDYRTPSCPRCDVKLILRVSSNDQSKFWGCPNYPRCKYKLNTASGAAS